MAKVSNSTMTIWFEDESLYVVLNRPRKPPTELTGIWNPTGVRKKAKPAPYTDWFRVSMVKEKRGEKSVSLPEAESQNRSFSA